VRRRWVHVRRQLRTPRIEPGFEPSFCVLAPVVAGTLLAVGEVRHTKTSKNQFLLFKITELFLGLLI
jgi:hypothetical protein